MADVAGFGAVRYLDHVVLIYSSPELEVLHVDALSDREERHPGIDRAKGDLIHEPVMHEAVHRMPVVLRALTLHCDLRPELLNFYDRLEFHLMEPLFFLGFDFEDWA